MSRLSSAPLCLTFPTCKKRVHPCQPCSEGPFSFGVLRFRLSNREQGTRDTASEGRLGRGSPVLSPQEQIFFHLLKGPMPV